MTNDERTHAWAAAAVSWWLRRWRAAVAAELEQQARGLQASARRLRGER